MQAHTLQFYESDAFLVEGLCSYAGNALKQGARCIVICKRNHLAMLELRLLQEGIYGEAGCDLYFPLQAEALIERCVFGGHFDESRFLQVMEELIGEPEAAAPLYLASEIAALLPSREPDMLLLEQCWARLQARRSFSLLCALPLAVFPRQADAQLFGCLCDLHQAVMPAESYDCDASGVEQLRAVAFLQQQAHALQGETARRRQAERGLQLAHYDSLTGLPNRHVFHDRLALEMKKAQRIGLPLALMFIDLDYFKQVNDTLGHDRGDALLVQVARRLSACVRKGDTVARLGGDEFTLIMSALADASSVGRVAQSVLLTLAEPFDLGTELAYISASIGIAFYPQDTREVAQLIKCADQAMYASKQQGGNRATYFTRSMHEAAEQRLQMTNMLRRALLGQQFQLLYQPVVEMDSGAMHQAEALLRWQHPTHGLLAPPQFMEAAEQSGLIVPIGDWVLAQAAEQAAGWRDLDGRFQVRVNLSSAQFRQDSSGRSHVLEWAGLLERLCHWKGRASSAEPAEIMLEIPEALLPHPESAVAAGLVALRQAGVQLSLDDYEGGSATLPDICRYGVDYLKISQATVAGLEYGADARRLCRAIIAMAHELGLKVVASGVQTALQRQLLGDAGCDLAQGFLYGRPMPAAELQARLAGEHGLHHGGGQH